MSPQRSAKERLRPFLPGATLEALDDLATGVRRRRIRAVRRLAGTAGFNVVKRADYYSTIPVLEEVEATRARWDRPSALAGLRLDPAEMAERLFGLIERWSADFAERTGDYAANQARGFGPGYPPLDARILYSMLREHRPRRYLEIGSGLSTYYASLAAAANASDGASMAITCVEPHPFDALRALDGVSLRVSQAQDVALEVFTELEAGDVLFIDSSHALKVDSDVAFLFLEALPLVAPGVLVHIHDVPFPYNTPFPADTWIFGERWPVYWNEAMLVQAFLAFNDSFEALLSIGLVRHHQEDRLVELLPGYVPVADDPNPPSSLWLRRTR